jgi:hypothetical protein
MQRGRPKAELVIPPEDLATLQRWTARRKTAQALALRSQILRRIQRRSGQATAAQIARKASRKTTG